MATGFYEVGFNNTGFYSGISINLTVAASTQVNTSVQQSNLTVVHLITVGSDTQTASIAPASITVTKDLSSDNCNQINSCTTDAIVYAIDTAASNCVQSSTAGTGTVTITHGLDAPGVNAVNTSGTGSISVIRTLVQADNTQVNTDSSGSINRTITITHSNCTQTATSSSEAIYIPPPGTLNASNCVQVSTSSIIGSLTVTLTLAASNCVQASISTEVPRYTGNNNLRIIYNNLIDDTSVTMTGSSSATSITSISNLRNNVKTSVWRTGNSLGKAIVILSFTSRQVGGVVIPFSNLTGLATIRIRAFTGTVPSIGGTLTNPTVDTTGSTYVADTDYINACPSSFESTSTVGEYAHKYGNYARAWLGSNVTCTSLVIEISDTSLTYIEMGKLVVGSYISASYNVPFGSNVTFLDSSTITRTESGNRIPNKTSRNKNLSLEFKYLNEVDRENIKTMLQTNGLSKPILISLYPQVLKEGINIDCDLETTYSIYGGLTATQQLMHSTYKTYSNSLELEEV